MVTIYLWQLVGQATSGNKLNKFLGGKLSGSITSATAKTASAVNMAFGNVQYTTEIYHSPLEISEGIFIRQDVEFDRDCGGICA